MILAAEAPIMLADYSEYLMPLQPWVKEFPSAPFCKFLWKDVVIEAHAGAEGAV